MIIPTPRRLRLSALAAVAGLCAMTGAAYAAGVPGAAASVLHRLGIATPVPATHSGSDSTPTHGSIVSAFAKSTPPAGADKGAAVAALASGGRSHAGEHGKAGSGDAGAPATSGKNGHGATISTLARTTTATGAAKGATISAAASGAKSHAGQHGGGATGSGHAQGGDHSTRAGGRGGGGGHGAGAGEAG